MPDDPSATLSAIRERAMTDDEVAAYLEHVRALIGTAQTKPGDIETERTIVTELFPGFVAAVDAVLALAGKWDRVDARLGEIGRDSAPVGDLRREMAFSHAKIFEDCAAALREAITSALTGEPANPSAPAAGTGEDEKHEQA